MPAFILDLDGTLVDTVYLHVVAWSRAFASRGHDLPMWRIHRKVGMSGALLMQAFEVEIGRRIGEDEGKQLEDAHTQAMKQLRGEVRLLSGAPELLQTFRRNGVRFAIASSGHRADIGPFLEMLDLDGVPVVTGEDAKNAKPDPELFLKAAEKLRARSEETMVVGDSVWDMLAARRAHFLGVGLLTGGYAESEMTGAGAFRVYADPQELCARLQETGVRIQER